MQSEKEDEVAYQAWWQGEMKRRTDAGQGHFEAYREMSEMESRRARERPWTSSDWKRIALLVAAFIGLSLLPFVIGGALFSKIAPITRWVFFVGALVLVWKNTSHLEQMQRIGLLMVVWLLLFALNPLKVARWIFGIWIHGMESAP